MLFGYKTNEKRIECSGEYDDRHDRLTYKLIPFHDSSKGEEVPSIIKTDMEEKQDISMSKLIDTDLIK